MEVREYKRGRALCMCGCGEAAPIAPASNATLGIRRGFAVRYVKGHAGRRWCTWRETPDTNCWLWTAYIMPSGYGLSCVGGKKQTAHRAVYEEFVGPVPDGLELDHLCRVRACVNPGHLEPVTRAENGRRGRNSKLTEQQVREIRALAPTTGRRELGRRYGVSHQTVRQIIDRRIWADLEDAA